MRAWMIALAWLAFGGVAAAQERPLLHPMFQDHAVLQRGKPIAVWGWAAPGERVSVRLDRATRSARADAQGRWRVDLPAHQAGGPLTLEARAGARSETISDLLVGDVYLCSGQSNMEFTTRFATNAGAVLNSANDPQMRLFNVRQRIGETPQDTFETPHAWAPATSASVADFSAVCYFFGAEIRRSQDIPIGLIASSWGGTIIEAWMRNEALAQVGGFDAQLALLAENRRDPTAARAELARTTQAWWRDNDPGTRANWNAADFDDSAWASLPVGVLWEDTSVSELAGFDGLVWLRTEFNLTAAQAVQGARLELGPADDIDATYLNGALIGATNGYNIPRTYEIAPGALRAGRNVLATAIADTGGGGGWWGAPDAMALRFADGQSVPLAAQPWRYKISATLDQITSPPMAPWNGPNAYSVLNNGMIAPLAPYGLAGVLWYQGEANAGAPEEYARLLPGWMRDWRSQFEAPQLPFFIVQLANYGPPVFNGPTPNTWGRIRDVQRRAVDADPRAALAVTIDIGDRYDIHPTQKLIVAQRLALPVRRMIYGEDVITTGPTPVRAQRSERVVRVTFEHGPLLAYSSNRPMAFEICDAARACRFTDATIVDEATILLDAPGEAPVAFVRYCWGDSPVCNLYNAEDLPAVPFELAITH